MTQRTPMIEQYLRIKSGYPDAILFYRMGDFYEMFFEDAQVASRELEITLTSRNKGDEESVPLCGVPYHAADAYIARLIERGYKVAILHRGTHEVDLPQEVEHIHGDPFFCGNLRNRPGESPI